MNIKNFTELLKNPQNIDSENSDYLISIINEYPYFQSARSIYLKGLKKNDSLKYNSELKKTAAYTTDRTILFNFITSPFFTDDTKDTHQQKKEDNVVKEELIIIEEALEIGKPISFSPSESHSFNQWLQLSTHKKIDRKQDKQLNKTDIINSFIKQNPKISRVSKDADKKEVNIIEKQDSYLMTETLAKVYLEQKKYENAIKAYEILSLKYPEKSGFFADQIKRIRILQNK